MTAANDQSTRVVLLGASNLTRGFPTVVNAARSMWGPRLRIFACLGHGRSFGVPSTVLGRTLPGIIESGIWDALRSDATPRSGDTTETAKQKTFALITDIGNDIMYGASPQTIAGWIEQCIDRLEPHDAEIGITALPIDSIRDVRRWQYEVVRAILYPTRRITFAQAIARANELHDRIASLAERRGITMVACDRTWYGFDPIHIRRRCWPDAWKKILHGGPLGSSAGEPVGKPSLMQRIYLKTRTPERWRLLGVRLGRPQPSARLPDGSTVFLY